jgi:5-methyltetrahydrofolate--homocysteine methyltransferase
MPNAGMPINENGLAKYLMSPKEITEKLSEFIKKYQKIRLIGGCCGTSPEHIMALRKMLDDDYSTTSHPHHSAATDKSE